MTEPGDLPPSQAKALGLLREHGPMRGHQGATDGQLRVINQATANALLRRGLVVREATSGYFGAAPAIHPYTLPLVGFDLETTSSDPESARIVGASVIVTNCAPHLRETTDWVVNPGVPIEASATEVHGFTDDYVREHGVTPLSAVVDITERLYAAWAKGWPVVIYNASFDLTTLDRERRRLGLAPLDVRGLVLDPFILDHHVIPRRSGPGARKLRHVVKVWNADNLDAVQTHVAGRDALAACRLVYMIGRRTPALHGLKARQLMELQATESRAWRADLREWFMSQGDTEQAAGVREEWPIWPWRGEQKELEQA